MDTARVTLADLEDLDDLVELWVALAADQRTVGSTIRADANAATARQWLSELVAGGGIFVARADNELLGFVTFDTRYDRFSRTHNAGVIHNLFVRAAVREQGIGSRLLAAAAAALAARGHETVTLEVLAANEEARAFYEDRAYELHRRLYRKSIEETDKAN